MTAAKNFTFGGSVEVTSSIGAGGADPHGGGTNVFVNDHMNYSKVWNSCGQRQQRRPGRLARLLGDREEGSSLRRRRLIAGATALAVLAGAVGAVLAVRAAERSPLSFAASGVDFSGYHVYPGQAASYAAFLTANPRGIRFTVTNVSLLPLPGFHRPKFLGAEFLVRQRGVPLTSPGYPPTGVPVHRLLGYTAVSGPHPYRVPVVLLYGLRARRPGGYAAAGIMITYQVAGRSYTAKIYNGADLFVVARHETNAHWQHSMSQYDSFNNRANNALVTLADG